MSASAGDRFAALQPISMGLMHGSCMASTAAWRVDRGLDLCGWITLSPSDLSDHLLELNQTPRFWGIVKTQVPTPSSPERAADQRRRRAVKSTLRNRFPWSAGYRNGRGSAGHASNNFVELHCPINRHLPERDIPEPRSSSSGVASPRLSIRPAAVDKLVMSEQPSSFSLTRLRQLFRRWEDLDCKRCECLTSSARVRSPCSLLEGCDRRQGRIVIFMPTRVYRMMGVTATFDDRLAPPRDRECGPRE